MSTDSFTSLGPAPEQMSGYGHVSGRVNAIAIDPEQTNVAYFAAVGGGVWKTTNCCTTTTTWMAVTDKPHINGISINDVHIDPTDHNTVYAGTGDLNFGSFAMGTIGVLRSNDQGATWDVLGADVFTPVYPPNLTPTFPQYQAIGKVRVDPNNGSTIIAGTKTGLFFSWDDGANWPREERSERHLLDDASGFTAGRGLPGCGELDTAYHRGKRLACRHRHRHSM